METPTQNDATPDIRTGDGCMARLVRLLPCPFCGSPAKRYHDSVTCSNSECKMHFAAVPDMHTPEEWNERWDCDECVAYRATNEQLRKDLKRVMHRKKGTRRKAFVCAGCDFVYCDEPPTSCDCMCNPAKFIEGEIFYSLPNAERMHHHPQ